MENLFEKASRLKLRFKVSNGVITVEDLWDLSLESLDVLARALNKEVKSKEEESFIKTRTNANKVLDLSFEIVKHVITVRLAEDEEKKVAAAKRAKRAQILELIGRKEIQTLEGKSVEELTKELEALG